MSTWKNFWVNDPKLFGTVMRESTLFFAERLARNGILEPWHQLLDVGCGPGYLAEAIRDQVSGYWGADISPSYVQTCNEKFQGNPNFHFALLPDTPPSSGLPDIGLSENHFDRIIILSVVQYLNNLDDVYELLKACKQLLAKNGKIILADVIASNDGLVKDAMNVLENSIRRNYFISFLRFMYEARFSSYNRQRIENKLLCLTEKEVGSLCQSLGLQYQILPRCTIQASRVTYCITA